MDKFAAPNLRVAAINALGGKCVKCGWAVDPEGLQVVYLKGNSTEEFKGRAREKYFLQILTNPDPGSFAVLCGGCKAVYMKHRRQAEAAKRNPEVIAERPTAAAPVLVWSTEWRDGIYTDPQPRLQQHVGLGGVAFIHIRATVEVYRYAAPQRAARVAQRWREFTANERLGAVPPPDAEGFWTVDRLAAEIRQE